VADRNVTRDADFAAYLAARQASLLRTAYLLTGNRHDAEDLVQIAFAKLYLSWDKVRDQGSIDGYVRRILVNEHNSLWRRAWKRRESSQEHTVLDRPVHDEYDEGTGSALWDVVQTLPRKARIINALAGLAVDLVTASVLFTLSHTFAGVTLITAVCWRIAVTQVIGIVENGLPILEVDGHVALTDYLDEPDLSPRSREALRRRLSGNRDKTEPSWLAAYGAFSLIGGIVLIGTSTWVWWLAAGDLIRALFSGNLIEMLLGLYILVPLAIGVLFSTVGLGLEMIASSQSSPARS
jgi:DNA-directed RNA polymerase specialized sigma24 family protein